MVLNVLACPTCAPDFGAIFEPTKAIVDIVRPWREGVHRRRATRVARGGRSSMRRNRRSGERTRPRTRTARACHESARPDMPTGRPRKTRCTTRGGTTRTRSATRAPRPGTGALHLDRQRARYSLLRGPLRGLIRPGLFIPCPDTEDPPPREAIPNVLVSAEDGVDDLENVFTAQVRSHGSSYGGADLTEQLTTGALLLVIGAVLTIIGIVFFPFLCVGIPLLVVGLILIVAESGRVTKPPAPLYPGYGPSPPYAPYAPLPPPAGRPKPSDDTVASPGPSPTRYCVNCGAALTPGAAFCAQCGAPVQR